MGLKLETYHQLKMCHQLAVTCHQLEVETPGTLILWDPALVPFLLSFQFHQKKTIGVNSSNTKTMHQN